MLLNLDVEGCPNMPRNSIEAISEDNDPVPQQEDLEPDQPTPADISRMFEELFDKSGRKMDEHAEEMRVTDQRLASLEQDARQPRLVMEADGPVDERRIASARRAPLQQYKRCMGIAFLPTESIPIRCARPVSA